MANVWTEESERSVVSEPRDKRETRNKERQGEMTAVNTRERWEEVWGSELTDWIVGRGGVKGANSETEVLAQSVTESEMRIRHSREKYCRLIMRGNTKERDDHQFPFHCIFVNLVLFLFLLFYPIYPILTYTVCNHILNKVIATFSPAITSLYLTIQTFLPRNAIRLLYLIILKVYLSKL